MNNKKIGNISLYLLAAANLIYALMHGFTWLHFVTFGLTSVVLIFDFIEVFTRGKQ